MKVNLTTGAYSSRSLIASAQRCVNLYPEKNPEDAPFPTTYYPTPGLKRRGTTTYNVWRCLYTATNGRVLGVIGQKVVNVNADGTFTDVGLMVGTALTPCYMADNGTSVVLVDGSPAGYTIDLVNLTFAQITDEAFYGSDRVDIVDGYFLFNRPGTQQFYISLLNKTNFDPLDFASKAGAPDLLVGVMATRRNVFLFGEATTEIWTNTGGSAFTFSRVSGTFLQFGCAAKHSLAQADGSIYWISQTPQGSRMVMRTMNYDRQRVSNFAIEAEFQTYSKVDDAIGWVEQFSGHFWYVLTFPTANKTWVFDISADEWFERAALLPSGEFTRHRANCYTFALGSVHLVGDYESGNLYELSQDQYTDDGDEIRRVRSFPHLLNDGKRVVYTQLQAAMQVGAAGVGQEAEIRLRWSDTKGYSWQGVTSATLGARGEYIHDVRFLRLGMARDRVFELSWTAAFPTALNGAFLQLIPSAT